MLPTIHLQLSEPTRFDTGASAFAPDAAAEPTAMFADVLALKTPGPQESGELLPVAGNALPLLAETLEPDPALRAELMPDAESPVISISAETAPDGGAALAPTSIVAPAEVLEVTLDLEPVPADGGAVVRPVDELPVIRELGLPALGPAAKDARPAVPPGPIGPVPGPAAPDAAETRAAALLRDVSPQRSERTSVRPVNVAAYPEVSSNTEAPLPRTGAAATAEIGPSIETVAARTNAQSAAVRTDAPAVAAEPPRPAPEPLASANPLGPQAARSSTQAAASQAENVADLRLGDIAAVTRTASEPQAPRQAAGTLPPIDTPVQQPDWDRAISERVVMMANNKLQQAEIRLTPAELGPLRVQVSVDDGAANVTFQAQHAMTREAIEQALPRLRELFAENGLSLGQTSVGHEDASGGDESRSSGIEATADDAADVQVDEPEAQTARTRVTSGLVDTFV